MNSKALFVILAITVFSVSLTSLNAYGASSVTQHSEATVNEQTSVTLSGEQSSDPHNQEVSYQWQQMSGEPVQLSSNTDSEITFTTPEVDPGQVKDLQFALTVVNPQGLTSITSFTLHVVHVNHPPVVTTEHDITVMEGNPVTLMATAQDPDNDNMTYKWTQDSGTKVNLSSQNELTTMFTAPAAGPDGNSTLKLTITADDGNGGQGSDTVQVHILGTSTYKISTLSCGPIIRSHEGGAATLAVQVDNPSNAPLTYQWTQISGAPIPISDTTSSTPSVSLPTGSGGNVYGFQITLKQSGTVVGDCEQYVFAAFPEPSSPPQADAGPDRIVNAADQVTLDGSKSTGMYIEYNWVQIAGELVQLHNANSVMPSLTAPDVPLGQSEELVFTNTVINPFGKDAAVVHITVVHPSLPPNAVITLK